MSVTRIICDKHGVTLSVCGCPHPAVVRPKMDLARALTISNDVSEGIDNGDTREELREAIRALMDHADERCEVLHSQLLQVHAAVLRPFLKNPE